MMFRRMQKTSLGGVDTGRRHRRARFAGVYTPVNVFVPVMLAVAREHSARLMPASTVKGRALEYLYHRWSMMHANTVWIISANWFGKNVRSGTPCGQPIREHFFGFWSEMSRLRGPQKFARSIIPEPHNKYTLPVLWNSIIFSMADSTCKCNTLKVE